MTADDESVARARAQLVHEVHEIRLRLERYAGVASGAAPSAPTAAPNSPLEQLCEAFDLDPFERAILVMCAGVEFDPGFAQLCGQVNGDPTQTFATFGLAMATLPNPFWAAASPAMSLRRWNLVELGDAPSLARTPVRIDEAVLHFLLEGFLWDTALEGIVRPLESDAALPPSHFRIGQAVAAVMTKTPPPVIQLVGPGAAERRAVATAACAEAALTPFVISSHAAPIDARERARLSRRWDRLARLLGAALVIEDAPAGHDGDREHQAAVHLLAEAIEGPVIVSRRSRLGSGERPSVV